MWTGAQRGAHDLVAHSSAGHANWPTQLASHIGAAPELRLTYIQPKGAKAILTETRQQRQLCRCCPAAACRWSGSSQPCASVRIRTTGGHQGQQQASSKPSRRGKHGFHAVCSMLECRPTAPKSRPRLHTAELQRSSTGSQGIDFAAFQVERICHQLLVSAKVRPSHVKVRSPP